MSQAGKLYATLFSDIDVLVVVDDWKGTPGKSRREPTYFTARGFFAGDPCLPPLIELLDQVGAACWHASGSRKTHRFLFDEPRFDEILAFLSQGNTCLYDQLESADAFATPAILQKWHAILAGHPDLRSVWDVDDNPYAMSFFRFADFLAWHLDAIVPANFRVRVLVDTLDWMSSRSHLLASRVSGIGYFGWNDRLELATVVDRTGAGARPYLPLLGLVDSEAWAFGRFNSLTLPDGTVIRDRYLDWQAGGSAASVSPVSEAEVEAAIAAAHAGHPKLRAYWDALASWRGTRSITLREHGRQTAAV